MEIVQGATTLVPTSGGTLTWTGEKDFSAGAGFGRDVVAIGVEFAAGGTARANDISRVTLKRGSTNLIDVVATHLSAYTRRFSRANYAQSTDLYWLLPLYLLEAKADEDRYRSAFPFNGESMTLELLLGSFSAGTETAKIFTVRAPEFAHDLSPYFKTEALNVAASSTLAGGLMRAQCEARAYTQLLTNLTNMELYAGGRLLDRLTAQMLGACDLWERGTAPATGVVCRKLTPVLPRGTDLNLRLTTGSSWAATDVGGVFGFNPIGNPTGA